MPIATPLTVMNHVKMRSLYHVDAMDDHGSFFKGPAMEFIDMLP